MRYRDAIAITVACCGMTCDGQSQVLMPSAAMNLAPCQTTLWDTARQVGFDLPSGYEETSTLTPPAGALSSRTWENTPANGPNRGTIFLTVFEGAILPLQQAVAIYEGDSRALQDLESIPWQANGAQPAWLIVKVTTPSAIADIVTVEASLLAYSGTRFTVLTSAVFVAEDAAEVAKATVIGHVSTLCVR